MLIKIYDKTGILKAEISPDNSSTQVKEIQGGNVLTLSFTLPRHIALDVDDYADFMWERYRLTKQYRPKQKSTVEWIYNLKMYGAESLIRNFLVIKSVDGDNEPEFSLTASPREHMALIAKCINDGFGTNDWKVGRVEGNDNIVIDYRGKYCDEALRELAEKVGVEYWAEGTTLNLCRCEHGESVELGYNNGLLSLDCGDADNVKFYTRLFPVGSSRNIDPERYGSSRLRLPGGQRFIEVNADKYSRVDHYEESAFADIYPHYTGMVTSVRSEEVVGNDGNKFTVYYFKDDNLPFDPNEYEIGRLVKRVSFQEGSELAGLGNEDNGTYFFEVNFNSDTREFEIITIWPYDDGTQLPGATLRPKPGDCYIPWNIRMPDEYYRLAEAEFLDAVDKFNTGHALDIAVYKAPTDHVWIEQNNIDLQVGRRIRLISDKYFPEQGYRDSRITKITRKVNLPSQMDLEIGDAISCRSLDKVRDSIADIRNFVESGKAGLPDIVRTGDKTPWTDNNLLSALRSMREFLSKTRDDTAEGVITFLRGLVSKELARLDGGATFGETIDSMLAGKGTLVTKDGRVQTDRLEVRGSAMFTELIVNRLMAQESDMMLSESGHIEKAEEQPDGTWLLTIRKRWDFDWTAIAEHDIVYGDINTLLADGSYVTSWMRVLSVNQAANTLSVLLYPDAEVPGGANHAPVAGMNIIHRGNTVDTTRQSCWYLSSREGCIVYLEGVTKPILEQDNYHIIIGKLKRLDIFNDYPINYGHPYIYVRGLLAKEIYRVDYKGSPVYERRYLGQWDPAGLYIMDYVAADNRHWQDTVTHLGCVWICVVKAATVGRPPAYNNPEWDLYEGNPDLKVEILGAPHAVNPRRFSATLGIRAVICNQDVTADILPQDIQWTRYSEDSSGAQRAASDNVWAAKHAPAGGSLTITEADLDKESGLPPVVIFTVTVTLRDGASEPRTASAKIRIR